MLEVTMVVVLSTDLVLAVADGGGAREPGDCHLLPSILLWSILDDLKLLRSRQSLILGIDLALGLVGRIQLPSEQAVPLETLEERVRLELGVAFRARAQALGSISLQQAPDEALRCLVVEHLRELQLRLPDLFVDLVLAAGVRGVRDVVAEGELPGHEVVDTDTEAPEVRHRRVAFAQQRFRRHVVHGAPLLEELAVDDALGDAEVDDLQGIAFDRPLVLEQKVLGFQVSVADALAVHVVHGTEDLLHDDGGLSLGEVAQLLYSVEELAAIAELQDKIDVPRVLKALVQPINVRVVQPHNDFDLALQPLFVSHQLFRDALDGPRRARSSFLAQDDGCVASLADDLTSVHLEVVVQDLACVVDQQGLLPGPGGGRGPHLQGLGAREGTIFPAMHASPDPVEHGHLDYLLASLVRDPRARRGLGRASG
mmetsp:Transcript_104961/g.282133  ORF Transcript_104961/g.282133 Transcript_104961/m.282133 type:complete len:426 (+) Transcript_104961:327-1604(+)